MEVFSVFIFGFILFGSVLGFDPCVNYTVIHEPRRSTQNVPAKNFLCDRLIKSGWTRFRDAEMPFNTCIKPYHCGTHIPIWLQGTVPTVSDGIVTVTACADMTPDNSNCCEYTFSMNIKNCGGFMVYDLQPVIGCSIAYCAGGSGVCTGDKYSRTGFEPCDDACPKLTGNPVLEAPEILSDDFKFTCHIPYDPQKHDADFTVIWLIDGKPIAQPVTLRASGVRDVIITGDQLLGELGKSLSCSVTTAFADNHTGVISSPWQSNTYWMGVKYQSNSIHMEPAAGEKTLDIISTIPVVCKGPGQCGVDLHIHTDNDGVLMKDCVTKLRPTDWNIGTNMAKTTTTLAPKPGQTNSTTTLNTTTSTHNTGGIWNSLTVDPVHVSIAPGPGSGCSLTGDPHITTFDETRSYYMPLTGQFTVLRTKSMEKQFRVDIRTWKCRRKVCICGVVAREGNDVVGLDLCHGRYRRSWPKFLIDRSLFTNETVIQHDDTGRNYVFKFPSAAYVKAQAGGANTHVDVHIHVPDSMKRRTEGLCGFFDGNKYNDLTEPSGTVKPFEHTPVRFSETWRIQNGQSLFERIDPLPSAQAIKKNFCDCSKTSYKDSCPTTTPPGPPIEVLCPNCRTPPDIGLPSAFTTRTPATTILSFSAGPIMSTSTPVASTSMPNTFTTSPLSPYEFTYATMQPMFPTVAPLISQANASGICNTVIHAYKPATECIQNVYNLNVTDIKASCTEDLMYTGDYEFAVSALATLVEQCAMELLKNHIDYNTPNGSNSLIKVCPGACSGNGQCYDGKCDCKAGFSGSDCSVDLILPPTLKEIVGGNLCDSNNEECYYPIMVGENLLKDKTSCVLREMEFYDKYVVMKLSSQEKHSIFGSTNHVYCPLPKPPVQLAVHGYVIRLKTGGRESGEQLFTIFNSKCINCSDYQHCVQKSNTCLIENQCYLPGETNSLREYCNSAVNNKSWSDVPPTVQSVASTTIKLPDIINLQSVFPSGSQIPVTEVPHASTAPPAATTTLPTDVATKKSTLPPTLANQKLPTAPLGGIKTSRADIWTKQDTGCQCNFDSSLTTCACCEMGGEQCPRGDMCVKTGDTKSCGTKKPSDAYGEDYWTATFMGCGCLFDFTRADCACCQNQGCPCSAVNHNQCVDCLHADRCGKKPWIFGPDFTT